MAAALPTSLEGQIVHSINYVPAVTATRFEVASDVPLKARFGPKGGIGIAEGQAPVLFRLTFAGTAEKDQFELLARQQQQRNTKGFTYDFWEGSEGLSSHWIVRNCKIGSWSMTNDPETGITDKMVSIMGIKAEQIQ